MSHVTLANRIIELSQSDDWEIAKTEWSLQTIYEDEPSTCLCGHYPIVEHCIIENSKTNLEAIVGNCCVKKFLGLPSDKLFTGIKRVRKDIAKSLNEESLQFAKRRNWITAWEFSFYQDIKGKRLLSDKQEAIKIRINNTVLDRFKTQKKAEVIAPVKKLEFIVNAVKESVAKKEL